MKKVILVRCGEIILKGLNRSKFEDRLIANIKRALYGLGVVRVIKSQSRIYVEPESEDYDLEKAITRITKVFGIVSVSIAYKTDSDLEKIKELSLKIAKKEYLKAGTKTFKIDTKRGNKAFPLITPEINAVLGEHILLNVEGSCVDVNNPDLTIFVEVRENTYIYKEIIKAQGGMPIGTNGKAALLLSGGIDSPVAGYMIAKRGVEICAVHFFSYPYTSERAKQKVVELTEKISGYCGKIKLFMVPFTKIQIEIRDNCPEEYGTILNRRYMMRIAEMIAKNEKCQALITGESIGQVASQTMESLVVTDAAATVPVLRPLIGMDKNDVIKIAREIDTFNISIQPYEDCCTVFVAKHPKTKPKLEQVLRLEEKLNMEELMKQAVADSEEIVIGG